MPEEGLEAPDTRIMIGALALVFGRVEAGFVRLGRLRHDQICRLGDTVRDMVEAEASR
jgi:hypothetical protein